MKFSELVGQVLDLLQRQGRVSYRALRREFELDDDLLADLKEELLFTYAEQVKEEGPGLVWTPELGARSEEQGAEDEEPRAKSREIRARLDEEERNLSQSASLALRSLLPAARAEGERRQLTVLFCDLVGSTALSAQLDPEEYRAVVQHYHQTCSEVIQRHGGYLAQYLGDGLLVYFGYPSAHEDDARRAVRAGLEILTVLRQAGVGAGFKPVPTDPTTLLPPRVRIGIHSGLVVIGEIGSNAKRELLALGETPNIAARIQGLAEPNTVLISAATQRLVEGQFENQPFGAHLLKGLDTPVAVYHVQSERQSVSPLAGRTTLTPLIGREQEVGLLIDRWEQAKEGRGQVVLLSGEPGIGKSRLAYTLREHVTAEGFLLFEARCSPYHQHSALYPVIEVLQRTLLLNKQDTDREEVEKLEQALALYDMQNSLPLFTALLSLPTPSRYPPLNVTPQKQKERTLQALVQLLVAQVERQATVSVWEDLHWADPSSLEFLSLLIEQIPTTKLLLVLAFRPEFTPLWKPRSHISQLVLNRLGKKQVEAMIEKAAAGSTLSPEVIEQIQVKTDGVPLFVEEITKSVVESAAHVGGHDRASLPTLAIPATLQEALLARLDRLASARQVAQAGATLGREFSHELIQAVAPFSEADLHVALEKLVEAEILYQRGIGEQARYFFKHALIQDTAYQSLLKSTRQYYHQQIAQVLEEQFPQIKETQPELLAHHYTEAGLVEQAIPYWQQAGQKAIERSANAEAISHLTTGLDLLKTLPATQTHAQRELSLQLMLGVPLVATKGWAASEMERAYGRALELCHSSEETPQLFSALWGLSRYYTVRRELQRAADLSQRMRHSAQRSQDLTLLLVAYRACGATDFFRGELRAARRHIEAGLRLYDRQQHAKLAFVYGEDIGVACLFFAAVILWALGYPDQAYQKSQAAVVLAQELTHAHTLAETFYFAGLFHQLRREVSVTQELADRGITLCAEQGLRYWLAMITNLRGWALAVQGQPQEGIQQIEDGLAAARATGMGLALDENLAMLAEAYAKDGRIEEGLAVLSSALVNVDTTGGRYCEAELYRLKGELTLQKESQVGIAPQEGRSVEAGTVDGAHPTEEEAEGYFLKAIAIAQKQQAKSWELRAATSLARLWQSQGKKAEAHKLLSDVYTWFAEGFDTRDLQEAKALIEELMSDRATG